MWYALPKSQYLDTLSRYRPCTDTHPAVSAYATIGAYCNQGSLERLSLHTPLVGTWLSLLMRRRQGAYRYMPSTFLEHVGANPSSGLLLVGMV